MLNYEIEYMSELFRRKDGERRVIYLTSNDIYGNGTCVIVEHKQYGIFIGRIVKNEKANEPIDSDYRIVQRVDLDKYLSNIEKEKQRKILRKRMEEKFVEIDKEKKYEYYASIDADFKAIFDEYKAI